MKTKVIRRPGQKPELKKRSQIGEVWHRLKKSTPAMIAMSFLILLIVCTIAAPWIAPYDYAEQNLADRLAPLSAAHPLGTDQFGRDLLSRLLFGGRISLLVSLMSTIISTLIALVIGATVGYFGGAYDTIMMRFMDILIAIPGMMLTIVMSVALDRTLFNTALAMAVGGIAPFVRQLRASTLLVRGEEYIEAAKSFGSNSFSIIMRHVIPNTLAPVIVQVSMGLGANILGIAGLAFLGLGVQPPTPEWGNILSSGQEVMRTYWPLITFPGIIIGLNMLAFNLLGDGLRDAMDPKLKN